MLLDFKIYPNKTAVIKKYDTVLPETNRPTERDSDPIAGQLLKKNHALFLRRDLSLSVHGCTAV